jgi:hypothetical protein
MKAEEYDCTGQIGNLYNFNLNPEWPMFSFDRPAYTLWNAIAGQLHEAGWSDERIKEWLQSKETRWALDGDLGDALRELGRAYAAEYVKHQTHPEENEWPTA